jgi:hypothetical protein
LLGCWPSHGEAVYTITETELTELETLLTTQAETIELQGISLSEQASLIAQLQLITDQQETTISGLEILFRASEREAQSRLILPWTIAAAEAVIVGLLTYFLIK